MNLDRAQTLVLNADYKPLSILPLSTWSWQDTITSILLDKVNVVHEYDDVVIRSASLSLKLPSVIALKHYVKTKHTPKFTRYNIFARDNFTCQYCDTKHSTPDLTFDHVIPKSKGGRTEWTNIVTSCRPCNWKKADYSCRDANMHPINKPTVPTNKQLSKTIHGRKYKSLHKTWLDYVYWDTDLV